MSESHAAVQEKLEQETSGRAARTDSVRSRSSSPHHLLGTIMFLPKAFVLRENR